MDQPEAIMRDYRKAKAMIDDKSRISDRFGDDVDQIGFWRNMAAIMYAELEKLVVDDPRRPLN